MFTRQTKTITQNIFIIIAVAFFLLAVAATARAATYGPANEPCATRGIQLSAGENWAQRIRNANPGDILLLRGGTYNLGGSINMPAGRLNLPITVKPYNCQTVVINMSGNSLFLADYSIIAGLDIITTTAAPIIVRSARSAVIKNNRVVATNAGKAILVEGNSIGLHITGNDVSNPSTSRTNNTIRLLNGPNGTVIDSNRIHDCGEDCFQPELSGSYMFTNNWVHGPAFENAFDLKETKISDGQMVIRHNYFDGTMINGACGIIHGNHPANSRYFIEDNYFSNCNQAQQIGASTNATENVNVVFGNNVIIDSNKINGAASLHVTSQFTGSGLVENNVFIESRMNASGLTVRNNEFLTVLPSQYDLTPEEFFGSGALAPPQPSADSDLDGIPDTSDQCPGTPEGTSVDATGCPAVQPPPTTALTIPGIIEAENYKAGGEGIGFHDTSLGNNGGSCRTDNVDIKTVTGEGCTVGWTESGEWLAYDVAVQAAGTYAVSFRVANGATTNGSIHLELNGANITGPVSIAPTGGWGTQADVTVNTNVSLSAGAHTLKIFFDTAPMDLNRMTFALMQTSSADLNRDGSVNALDWSMMNARWFSADPVADINNDGIVNSLDFSILNGEWGQ